MGQINIKSLKSKIKLGKYSDAWKELETAAKAEDKASSDPQAKNKKRSPKTNNVNATINDALKKLLTCTEKEIPSAKKEAFFNILSPIVQQRFLTYVATDDQTLETLKKLPLPIQIKVFTSGKGSKAFHTTEKGKNTFKKLSAEQQLAILQGLDTKPATSLISVLNTTELAALLSAGLTISLSSFDMATFVATNYPAYKKELSNFKTSVEKGKKKKPKISESMKSLLQQAELDENEDKDNAPNKDAKTESKDQLSLQPENVDDTSTKAAINEIRMLRKKQHYALGQFNKIKPSKQVEVLLNSNFTAQAKEKLINNLPSTTLTNLLREILGSSLINGKNKLRVFFNGLNEFSQHQIIKNLATSDKKEDVELAMTMVAGINKGDRLVTLISELLFEDKKANDKSETTESAMTTAKPGAPESKRATAPKEKEEKSEEKTVENDAEEQKPEENEETESKKDDTEELATEESTEVEVESNSTLRLKFAIKIIKQRHSGRDNVEIFERLSNKEAIKLFTAESWEDFDRKLSLLQHLSIEKRDAIVRALDDETLITFLTASNMDKTKGLELANVAIKNDSDIATIITKLLQSGSKGRTLALSLFKDSESEERTKVWLSIKDINPPALPSVALKSLTNEQRAELLMALYFGDEGIDVVSQTFKQITGTVSNTGAKIAALNAITIPEDQQDDSATIKAILLCNTYDNINDKKQRREFTDLFNTTRAGAGFTSHLVERNEIFTYLMTQQTAYAAAILESSGTLGSGEELLNAYMENLDVDDGRILVLKKVLESLSNPKHRTKYEASLRKFDSDIIDQLEQAGYVVTKTTNCYAGFNFFWNPRPTALANQEVKAATEEKNGYLPDNVSINSDKTQLP